MDQKKRRRRRRRRKESDTPTEREIKYVGLKESPFVDLQYRKGRRNKKKKRIRYADRERKKESSIREKERIIDGLKEKERKNQKNHRSERKKESSIREKKDPGPRTLIFETQNPKKRKTQS
ncbi:hypothetical protein ACJW31_05G069900 [Castanea mollissima]